ncbi:HAMP domain-containing sensor histidine kinase [Geitlerinema sp. PCC 9228]|jgi:signal transduction histidine kinase|uniref:sensor histidine kinase n=1 Tax=Geitlerinema sp. PCC 9228 TaxID=111611 RepID=UPI0008F9DAA2|nr:HAMP domain-containing sensor histidine kinase [Geitlerinema sp. PCC 9228]
MLTSATSEEFVTLCREQTALLSQSLGASLSMVYLTPDKPSVSELEAHSQLNLVPVVVYPETEAEREKQAFTIFLEDLQQQPAAPKLLGSGSQDRSETLPVGISEANLPQNWQQQHRSISPLIHEGVVMGFLVTMRSDRPWNQEEKGQISRISHTLALARIVDRRSQWWQHQASEQQQQQREWSQRLDDLLHQLRNPLTALQTFGKLLLKRLPQEDKNRNLASNILRESDRMQELLQILKQTAKTEPVEIAVEPTPAPHPKALQAATDQTGASQPASLSHAQLPPSSQLPSHPHSIYEILDPVLASAQAMAEAKDLQLQQKVSNRLPLIQVDATALREVLTNLLDNAVKYTPAGGRVKVEAGHRPPPGNQALQPIEISDTGPGIPEADLERIFERHYRGVQAQTDIPGTGLGLAIAKELVERMNGKIQAFSPALDRDWQSHPQNPGTTFLLWLPEAS